MAAGTLRKVVLAREVVVDGGRAVRPGVVLDRLRAAYPGCHVFVVDGFVGASPELLVSRIGDVVRSHPMAGTAPRGGDPTTDARLAASLLSSAKDRQEHQITIDMVHDTLLPWCSYLDDEAEPSIVAVANVQHLATLVEGRLSPPAPSVLELVAGAAPDPGGVRLAPRRGARVHPRPRGLRPRPLRGPGRLGRRDAATAPGRSASAAPRSTGTWRGLCAGVGIVADSDPVTELAETRAKLQAMLSDLVRP